LEIKTEQKRPQNSKKKISKAKYSRQEDIIDKTDRKDSSQTDTISDRSISVSTARPLFMKKSNVPKSKSKEQQIYMDFMDRTSPNFDESEINHVDVSFKGCEGDRSMINYEKRIGNLPLNIEDDQMKNKTLNRSLNLSRNEEDNSRSEELDNNEGENIDEVNKHFEKMTNNMNEYTGKENNNLNNDNIFPIGVHQGVDENPYMTADFVNAIHVENEIEDLEKGNDKNQKHDRRHSFGMNSENFNTEEFDKADNKVKKRHISYLDNYIV